MINVIDIDSIQAHGKRKFLCVSSHTNNSRRRCFRHLQAQGSRTLHCDCIKELNAAQKIVMLTVTLERPDNDEEEAGED